MSEAYDQAYGIFDHDSSEWNPLSLVSFHPAEDTLEHSEQYRTIRRFIKYGIVKRFGLNINEFLAQPRDIVEHMFSVAAEAVESEKIDLDSLEE